MFRTFLIAFNIVQSYQSWERARFRVRSRKVLEKIESSHSLLFRLSISNEELGKVKRRAVGWWVPHHFMASWEKTKSIQKQVIKPNVLHVYQNILILVYYYDYECVQRFITLSPAANEALTHHMVQTNVTGKAVITLPTWCQHGVQDVGTLLQNTTASVYNVPFREITSCQLYLWLTWHSILSTHLELFCSQAILVTAILTFTHMKYTTCLLIGIFLCDMIH